MEDFVPYELAVKLKEKGFKEKCIAYYWEKINEYTPSFVVEDNMPEDGICLLDLLSNHNQAEWSPFIDAPTISQVLKWVREEKKICITINFWPAGYNPEIFTKISKDKNKFNWERYIDKCDYYDSYELAALAGIEYILDNNLI